MVVAAVVVVVLLGCSVTHVNLKFYGHKEFLSFRATINFFAVCIDFLYTHYFKYMYRESMITA